MGGFAAWKTAMEAVCCIRHRGGLAIILVEFGKSFLLIRHAKVDLLIEALGVEDLQCDLDLILEQITGLFF